MLRRIVISLIMSAIALITPVVANANKSWEQVRQERLQEGRSVVRTADIEVRTLNRAILISTSRPVQVRVFTILGQLISQDNLSTGVSVLNLGQRGIFIVKVGDNTFKVAL